MNYKDLYRAYRGGGTWYDDDARVASWCGYWYPGDRSDICLGFRLVSTSGVNTV